MSANPALNGQGLGRPGDVIARWSTPLPPRRPVACTSCGEAHKEAFCPQCASPAGSAVGHMATLVEDGAGRLVIVVAQRRHGSWEPTRTLDATTDAVRALRRQHDTAAAPSDGGLW
jgi:predicted amidophosphoribosyltransferase